MIIKQYPQVTCLWCVLNNTICDMAMELKVINKIYGKHKFHYRKNKFLKSMLRQMFCSALIQPYFDLICMLLDRQRLMKKQKEK